MAYLTFHFSWAKFLWFLISPNHNIRVGFISSPEVALLGKSIRSRSEPQAASWVSTILGQVVCCYFITLPGSGTGLAVCSWSHQVGLLPGADLGSFVSSLLVTLGMGGRCVRLSIFVAISKSSLRGHSVTRSYDWVRETLVPPTCVFIELSGFHRFVLSLRLSPWSSNWQMSRKNPNFVFLNCLVLDRNWVLIACWGLIFEAKAEGKWALGQTGLQN